MKLDHLAIWADNPETLRDYYIRYFGAKSNNVYINEKNNFHSYFLSFDSGARIEIMHKPGIPRNLNDTVDAQHKGLIHFAFETDTMEEVDAKASQLEADGYKILRGPRKTGDGYYEFETVDPENNRLEVMALFVE